METVIEVVDRLNEEIELLKLWIKAAQTEEEYNEAREALDRAEEELLIFGVLE